MEVVLIAFWLLLTVANGNLPVRVLSYPPPSHAQGRSVPTVNLVATTAGDFIATVDRSLLYIPQDTSDLTVAMLNDVPAGIAAGGISAIMPCFGDGDCSYIVDILENMSWPFKVENVANPNVAISMSIVDDTYYYVASSAYASRKRKDIIKIAQCDVAAIYYMQYPLKFEHRITNRDFVSREFFLNFDDGLFVYFIAIDTVGSPHQKRIRVMRACRHEENATMTSGLSSMFEMELNCGPLTADASIISLSQLGEVVILGLRGAIGSFCVFNTTAINVAMTRAYDHCYSEIYQQLELPWSQIGYSCIHLSSVS